MGDADPDRATDTLQALSREATGSSPPQSWLVGRPIEVLNSARLLASGRQEFVLALTRFNQAQLRLFGSLGQPPTVAPPVMDRAAQKEASPAPH
jgi:hypothetical protein